MKTRSKGVLARNNVAPEVLAEGKDMPVDHSIRDKKIFIFAGRAKAKAIIGSISDHNRVNPYVFRTFVDFDPSDGKFDKRPAANSPALRAGLDHQAPPIAIEGCRRISPVDIGGYAR